MWREAKALQKLNLAPDVIVTSPLLRARRTAEIMAETLGLSDKLVEDARLGHSFDLRGLGKIAAAHPEAGQLMIVGHEPEFSAVVAALIGGGLLAIRKGGLARVDLSDGSLKRGELAWLLAPGLLDGE